MKQFSFLGSRSYKGSFILCLLVSSAYARLVSIGKGRGKDGEMMEWGVTRKAVGRLSDDELEMIRVRKLLSNAAYKHICFINIL